MEKFLWIAKLFTLFGVLSITVFPVLLYLNRPIPESIDKINRVVFPFSVGMYALVEFISTIYHS